MLIYKTYSTQCFVLLLIRDSSHIARKKKKKSMQLCTTYKGLFDSQNIW